MPVARSLLALLVTTLPGVALADRLARVEVYDRTARQSLELIEHDGRRYVVGEPRHQYEVRIHNESHGRMLAVTSVDGVNVVSGQTASEQQGGYVIDSWSSMRIDGWRKSLDEVATFYFTHLADSYAARTGRARNVGVIGIALFREHPACCTRLSEHDSSPVAPAAPAANERATSSDVRRGDARLGTGHGHREASPAQYVDFRRAAPTPDETIVIYYDSRQNLIAQGVLPPRAHVAEQRPHPFPERFTPDP